MTTFTAQITDGYSAHATASVTVPVSGTVTNQVTTTTFWGSTPPTGASWPSGGGAAVYTADTTAKELGMRFYTVTPGVVTGIRYWHDPSDTAVTRTARLWTDSGTLLGTATFTEPETSGVWNTATFSSPIPISAAPSMYRFSVSAGGGYLVTSARPTTNLDEYIVFPLRMPGWFWAPNGIYATTIGTFPTIDNSGQIYGTDVVFQSTQQVNPPVGPSYYSRWATSFTSSDTFFPITVFDQNPAFNTSDYQAVGVNTFLGLFAWPPDQGQIAGAHAAGMYACGGGDDSGAQGGSQFYIANPGISTAAASYVLGDEFDSTAPTTGPVAQSWAQAIRALDSTRPIYLGYGFTGATMFLTPSSTITIADILQQFEVIDITGADFYGLTSGLVNYPGVWVYGRTVDNMLAWVGGNMPVWGIVETNNPWGTGSSDGRLPTIAQIQSAVWLMLIHGARGITYFDHRFYPPVDNGALITGNYPAIAAAVTALNAQITSLAVPLNAPAVTGRMTVVSSNTTQAPPGDVILPFWGNNGNIMPWGRGAGVQIDTTVRQPGDGFTYIFAIGGNPGATTGTFTLSGPSGSLGVTGSTATVIGESRTVPISGNAFSDSFAADYTYHLYKIAT